MPKELTVRALLIGLLLGLLFALANLYLGLKVGVTLSASIPAAVISLALLKVCFKESTLVETNMVQTLASSCEAVATGTALTLPAVALIGETLTYPLALSVGLLGGLLGIALMIPLRHPLMIEQQDRLPYPEGRACAALLKSKHTPGKQALLALWGVLIGESFKVLSSIFHLFKSEVNFRLTRATLLSFNATPSLLGIGAILGIRLSLLIFAGGILTWWALIPLVSAFETEWLPQLPQIRETASPAASAIWANLIRFVGVGALAMGGLAHIVRLAPRLARSLSGHLPSLFRDLFRPHGLTRTQHDLPLLLVLAFVVIVFIAAALGPLSPLSALILVLLALLLVPLTSASVGVLGVSVSPLPGLLLCAVLIVGLLFYGIRWVTPKELSLALKLSAMLGVATAMAAETSQSLKTGSILGATPWKQQGGMLLVLIPTTLFVPAALLLLGNTLGFGTEELPAPHASLYAIVLDGILEANMPINLVAVGAVVALAVEMLGAPSLPFALGIFLPFSTSTAIGIGGIVCWLLTRRGREERALLLGAGLVAGDAISGVLVALLSIAGWIDPKTPAWLGSWATVAFYAIVVFLFVRLVRGRHAT